ncbi:MAG: outer membrane beta-barrel protein [Bacteroidetes bacterium]|nr:outer membrane beta-barrel protein [Bacteroidota bacterium]
MKKLLTILFSLFFIGASATPKGFYFGTRFGLGTSTIDGSIMANPESRLMWQIGIPTVYQLHPNVGIMADFMLTGAGAKGHGKLTTSDIVGNKTDHNFHDKISLLNGEIPLALKLNFGKNDLSLKVYGGMSLNFHFTGNYTLEFDDSDYNKDHGTDHMEMKDLEAMSQSLIFGAGLDIKAAGNRMYFFEIRGSQGLSNFGEFGGKNMKLNYFALNAGYYFH